MRKLIFFNSQISSRFPLYLICVLKITIESNHLSYLSKEDSPHRFFFSSPVTFLAVNFPVYRTNRFVDSSCREHQTKFLSTCVKTEVSGMNRRHRSRG